MITLEQLKASLGETEVSINGQMVRVRALTATETDRMSDLWPRPRPTKMRRDLTKGSAAPMIPDELDPDYQRAYTVWARKMETIQVAAAMGYTTAKGRTFDAIKGSDQDLIQWGEDAIAELRTIVPAAQLSHAWAALVDLASIERARDHLIVELPDGADPTDPDAYRLPDEYANTKTRVVLEILREYKIDPFVHFGARRDDPVVWSLLVADRALRLAEKRREQDQTAAS